MRSSFIFALTASWLYLSAHDPSGWTVKQSSLRQLNSVQIIDANTIMIVGGNESNDAIMYYARSADGGENWTMLADSANTPWLKSVHFANPLVGYAAGYDGLILKTTDGGLTWTRKPASGNAATRDFNSVFFLNDQVGYVAGGNQSNDAIQTILKTTDGGANWSVQRDALGNWLRSIYFIDADTGYAAGDNGVLLKTTNGGTTWNTITITGSVANRNFNSVFFVNATTGFLGGGNQTNDSIQTIIKTTDAGHSWGIVKDNIAPWIRSIHFPTPTTGFAVGDYGTLLLTEDGGSSWNTIALPDSINDTTKALHAVHFLNADFGIAVGAAGKILVYRAPVISTPLVEAVFASDIGETSVILNAAVNANGSNTSVAFEYGVMQTFGTTLNGSPASVSGNTFTAVSGSLSGLSANTLYYFRVKAQNSSGVVYSDTRQFYTGGNPIPNWDFEIWDSIIRNVPQEWLAVGTVSKTTSYNSTSAVALQGDTDFPFGAVVFGTPGNDQLSGGTPFAARPDSIIGYFKYEVPNDSAIVYLMFKKNGVFNSQSFFYITGSSGGSFERLSFPISYSNGDVPDSVILAIASSDPFTSTPSANSRIEIDNISFAGTSVNVPNADFEAWEDVLLEIPPPWLTDQTDAGNAFMTTVTKTTDSQHGNFAVRLQNNTEQSRLARIATTDGSNPAFPVYARHRTFNGYFKYFPENGDSLRIIVEMYQNGQRVGDAYFYLDSTVAAYTPFSIPIIYPELNTVPDSAHLIIHAATNEPPLGNSTLYIDNLGFDGFYSGTWNAVITPRSSVQFKLYPNPAQNMLILSGTSEKQAQMILSIVDMQGKIITEKPVQLAAGQFQFPVDISTIENGVYLLTLQSNGAIQWKRFVVSK